MRAAGGILKVVHPRARMVAKSLDENDIGGNANGVAFLDTSSHNVARDNIITGNPAAQVKKTVTAANQQGADIAFRPDFARANNTIEDNFCLTYIAGSGYSRFGPDNVSLSKSKSERSRRAGQRLTSPAKDSLRLGEHGQHPVQSHEAVRVVPARFDPIGGYPGVEIDSLRADAHRAGIGFIVFLLAR